LEIAGDVAAQSVAAVGRWTKHWLRRSRFPASPSFWRRPSLAPYRHDRTVTVGVRSWVYGREAGRAGRAVDVQRNRRKVTNSAGRSSTLVAARVASSTSRTVTNTLRRNDLNSDPTVAAPLGRPAPPTSVRPRFLAPLRGFRRRPLRCRSAIHPRPNGYPGGRDAYGTQEHSRAAEHGGTPQRKTAFGSAHSSVNHSAGRGRSSWRSTRLRK